MIKQCAKCQCSMFPVEAHVSASAQSDFCNKIYYWLCSVCNEEVPMTGKEEIQVTSIVKEKHQNE